MTESVRLEGEQREQFSIGRRLGYFGEMKSDLQPALVRSGERIPKNLGVSFLQSSSADMAAPSSFVSGTNERVTAEIQRHDSPIFIADR